MKRVLWISDYFPRPNKPTNGIWALKSALALKNQGVDVIVLSPTPWIPGCLALTSSLKLWTNHPYTQEICGLKIFYPKCLHYPNKNIRKFFYKYFPIFESKLIYTCCKGTIADILNQYDFSAVHTNFMFPSGFIGYQIKKKYGIPHVFHERSVCRLDTTLKNEVLKKIYLKVLKESDAVITPSLKMAERIQKNFPIKKYVFVVRDPGDCIAAKKNVTERPEKYKEHKIVLSVGSLIERKGHEYLLKAVSLVKKKVPNLKCIVIGSGHRLKTIEKLIDELRLNETVELLGETPHDEVLRIMSWCDVFVLPSWDEAFGTVFGEAMTFGKPVIGCEGEGIGEVIQHGVHGYLVPKQNSEALSEKIERLLNNNGLAEKMGKNAKGYVKNFLNYEYIAGQLKDLYHEVAADKPRMISDSTNSLKNNCQYHVQTNAHNSTAD